MSDKKNIGPCVIASFDDAEMPKFFVANYRNIKEKFGHLELYAMMERAGVKEGETVPIFANWPDDDGVCVLESAEEARTMIEVIHKNMSARIGCEKLKVIPTAIFRNRFITETFFSQKWESYYWLHRRFQRWTAKGYFRKATLLKVREIERLSKARRKCFLAKDGRYLPSKYFDRDGKRLDAVKGGHEIV